MTGPGPGGAADPADPADAVAPVGQAGADALARATRALQDEPEPGWGEVADRLRDRLRSVSRPGRPLVLRDDDAGVLRVDERVVVDAVRRALVALPGCRPVGVDVVADDGLVARVGIQVWVDYGLDVRRVAESARAVAADVVLAVLGHACPVDVDVVDVELPAR
jgi:hypothetical protein